MYAGEGHPANPVCCDGSPPHAQTKPGVHPVIPWEWGGGRLSDPEWPQRTLGGVLWEVG
jgi:hypothetical protein